MSSAVAPAAIAPLHVAAGDCGRDGDFRRDRHARAQGCAAPTGARPAAGRRAPSSSITRSSIQCITSSLVNAKIGQPAGRFRNGVGGDVGEAQVDDLDLVAALLIEADRGAHERGDAIDLLFFARLIDRLALVVLGIDAIDQHRDRDAVHAPAFGDFRLGGPGDLVIDDFLRLAALLAGRAAALAWPGRAGQFVADRDLAFLVVVRGCQIPRGSGSTA